MGAKTMGPAAQGRRLRALAAIMALGAAAIGAPAAAQQACSANQTKCGENISRECLTSLGAGVLAIGDAESCEQQMQAYRACIAEVAASCPRSAPQQEFNAEAERFDELARLGGLVAAPETVVEFYNNALVYARRGDLLNGRAMLEKAIAAGAAQVDIFQRYAQVLKAQEGLIGAREITADLARRAPQNQAAALAAATLAPAVRREEALRALAEQGFAPAHFEIAQLYSADRLGDQSLEDQRAEKAALEAFQQADEAGGVYRWFLEKDTVEVWRETARRRLAVYRNRNLDVAPVTMSAMASNDGWTVSLQIIDVARDIRYRIGEGSIRSTGLTTAIDPRTGERAPRPFFSLPLGTAETGIEVWYDNIRGEEQGPFPLSFSAQDAFTASAKNILGALTQKWIEDRAWDNGSQLIYFTHLVSYRCGLSRIEYGLGAATPDREWPLTPCDPKNPYAIPEGQETYLRLAQPVGLVTIRLTYADGETSDVREFRF